VRIRWAHPLRGPGGGALAHVGPIARRHQARASGGRQAGSGCTLSKPPLRRPATRGAAAHVGPNCLPAPGMRIRRATGGSHSRCRSRCRSCRRSSRCCCCCHCRCRCRCRCRCCCRRCCCCCCCCCRCCCRCSRCRCRCWRGCIKAAHTTSSS